MAVVKNTTLVLSDAAGLYFYRGFVIFQDEDGDYLAKLSKLINGIGLQLIAGYQKYVPRISCTTRFLQNNNLADPSMLDCFFYTFSFSDMDSFKFLSLLYTYKILSFYHFIDCLSRAHSGCG